MRFRIAQAFPAGLDRLWTVFGRTDYPRRKYLALGATAVRMRCVRANRAGHREVDLERDVPLDNALLPAWTRLLADRRQSPSPPQSAGTSRLAVRARARSAAPPRRRRAAA